MSEYFTSLAAVRNCHHWRSVLGLVKVVMVPGFEPDWTRAGADEHENNATKAGWFTERVAMNT